MARPGDEDLSTDAVLQLQREANERLVVSAIRAQENAEAAASARRLAEEEARAARAREEALTAAAEFRELFIGVLGHDLSTLR